MSKTGSLSVIVIWFLVSCGLTAQDRPEPYHDGRKKELEYPGPGREKQAPTGLREVRIAYFGPSDPHHPAGGRMWQAAQLAIERANASGGYTGLPFRLVPVWSENPWGSGVAQLTRLLYEDDIWAILGGIDGPSTHLAEQAIAKARLLLLNPVSTDKSVGYAFVPWMFSLPPGDHLHAPLVCEAFAKSVGKQPFALLSATDHDSQLAMREYRKELARHGLTPHYHLEFEPGTNEIHGIVAGAHLDQAGAVLLIAGPEDSANLLRGIRSAGYSSTVFGGATFGRRSFLERAGVAAEGVVFPAIEDVSADAAQFDSDFQKRFGTKPDYAVRMTYDAVNLLVAAVRKAGLNRALIRDAVRDLSGWRGVSGPVIWDAVGQNTRPPRLATIKNGEVVFSRMEPRTGVSFSERE